MEGSALPPAVRGDLDLVGAVDYREDRLVQLLEQVAGAGVAGVAAAVGDRLDRERRVAGADDEPGQQCVGRGQIMVADLPVGGGAGAEPSLGGW